MQYSLCFKCRQSTLTKFSHLLEGFDFTLHIDGKSIVKLEILNLTLKQANLVREKFIKVADRLSLEERPAIIRIPEENWQENWKLYFKARRIAPHIVVRPEWEDYKAFSDDAVVVLNPGMAFGTGLHETTRSVLQLMDSWFMQNRRASSVIDVGTGSGIIAIAAAKLGFQKVVAIDCDDCAIKSAIENVHLNGVDRLVDVIFVDIADFKTTIQFDLVIANILAGILTREAHKIVKLLSPKPRAAIILSGVLKEQFAKVEACYKRLGMKLVKRIDVKDWSSGEFRRKI